MTPSQALKCLTFANRAHKPILEYVNITPIDNDRALLSAYDSSLHSSVSVKWCNAPSAIVSGPDLAKAVKGMDEWSGGSVTRDCLEINGTRLRILVGEVFPSPPQVAWTDAPVRLSARNMSMACRFRDEEGSSPALVGVCVYDDGNVAATDGKALLVTGTDDRPQFATLSGAMSTAIERAGVDGNLLRAGSSLLWVSDDEFVSIHGKAVEGYYPNVRPALTNHVPAHPLPIDVLSLVLECAGTTRKQFGVIISPTGAAPLNPDDSGKTLAFETGAPAPMAVNAGYIKELVAIKPDKCFVSSRGSLLAYGEGFTVLIMAITLPATDTDTTRDYSSAMKWAPGKRKPVKRESEADLRLEVQRLRHLLTINGIAY